jgi:hypothetical protein
LVFPRTGLGGAAGVAVVALAASCRPAGPPPVVDPALAACIPSDTLVVAGMNLDLLRASALYERLGPVAAAFLEPLREARYALVAYNGKDVLVAARGAFRAAPPGAVLLAKGLAVAGSPAAVRAAAAQRKTGAAGAPWLLDRGAEAQRFGQIWAVARGGGAMSLAGNAANLSRLLSLTEYATFAARFGDRIELQATGVARDAASAQRLEESLRGFVSLALLAAKRNAALAAPLRALQVSRQGSAAQVSLSASPEEAVALFSLAAR